MTNNTAVLIVSLVALSALGGCTSSVSNWNHASATSDQWAVDKAGCRSRARRQSEKEMGQDHLSPSGTDDEFTAAYARNMRTFDSGRRRQTLYESCLKRLGYMPAK